MCSFPGNWKSYRSLSRTAGNSYTLLPVCLPTWEDGPQQALCPVLTSRWGTSMAEQEPRPSGPPPPSQNIPSGARTVFLSPWRPVSLNSPSLPHPLQGVRVPRSKRLQTWSGKGLRPSGLWKGGGTGKSTSVTSWGGQSAQLCRTLMIFWWWEGFSAKQISSCRRNLRLFSKACCSSNYQSGQRAKARSLT